VDGELTCREGMKPKGCKLPFHDQDVDLLQSMCAAGREHRSWRRVPLLQPQHSTNNSEDPS
jgi:hypothetical protein